MSDTKSAKAAAKAAQKKLRLSHNVWSNKYFAIAIGAIMVLFAIYHWLGVIHFHYGRRTSHPTLTRKYRYVFLLVQAKDIADHLDVTDKSDAFFRVQRWG